jgi:2-polyprenyl-6-methoxyphenol hydroxylase-like FAD-dependent oxidoreductase
MMRGFFRRPSGPGWALIGDAGHFKHPATAQGISDAVEQALFVADALGGAGPGIDDYETWRDERAAGHYEFSFRFGTLPRPETAGPLFAGFESDPSAALDLRDVLSRRIRPEAAFTPARLARWFAAEPATV